MDDLSVRLNQLSTLEAANCELTQRNGHLQVVVKEQQGQLQVQKDTITRQAQQLQTQAVQLSHQAKQLQAQVQVIQQHDRTINELRGKLAAAAAAAGSNDGSSGGGELAAAGNSGSNPAQVAAPDAELVNEQIAMAVRAVLAGVGSMASVSLTAAKDESQVQLHQMVSQLPDPLLQQIRTCCREVALHLKKSDVKEPPRAISVPCC